MEVIPCCRLCSFSACLPRDISHCGAFAFAPLQRNLLSFKGRPAMLRAVHGSEQLIISRNLLGERPRPKERGSTEYSVRKGGPPQLGSHYARTARPGSLPRYIPPGTSLRDTTTTLLKRPSKSSPSGLVKTVYFQPREAWLGIASDERSGV